MCTSVLPGRWLSMLAAMAMAGLPNNIDRRAGWVCSDAGIAAR